MPLVVPGLSDGSAPISAKDWKQFISGKKLGDTTNETTFAKTELPEKHRVIKQGGMRTMDFVEDRLNFHVDDNDVVRDVTKG